MALFQIVRRFLLLLAGSFLAIMCVYRCLLSKKIPELEQNVVITDRKEVKKNILVDSDHLENSTDNLPDERDNYESEVELSAEELSEIRFTERTRHSFSEQRQEEFMKALRLAQDEKSANFPLEIAIPAIENGALAQMSLKNQQVKVHKQLTADDIMTMRFERPSETWRINSAWQAVNTTAEIYLYTAHYDDRPGLGQPAVRVIAVAEAGISDIFCILWYPHNDVDLLLRQADVIPIGPRIAPNLTKWYEEFFLSCNVSGEHGAPSDVSIITLNNTHVSNVVPVHVAERPAKQIEFGHCMSVVYWKLDSYRVVEWLELHKMWGVGEVNIYTNSVDKLTQGTLQHYVQAGFVTLKEAPSIFNDGSEATILLNMSPVINDCFYRNMYRYKKVICTDFDEMIVPRAHGNYSSMLEAIDKETKTNHTAPSYMFRNVYFFTDFPPVETEPWFSITARYLRHVAPSGYGYSIKSITDTRACIALQNHLCWRRLSVYDTKAWTVDVDRDLAMNHHYKKCHFDEYLGEIGECEKMMKTSYVEKTMLRFREELSHRMRQTLKRLHLLVGE